MGIVIMKTIRPVLERKPGIYRPGEMVHGATKWVLAEPAVATTILGMTAYEHVDWNLQAAGRALSVRERAALADRARQIAHTYCRLCGKCEPACPRQVAICDVMRFAGYYWEYRNPAGARARYASLAPTRSGAACDGCGRCNRACPFWLPVARRVQEAHRVLA